MAMRSYEKKGRTMEKRLCGVFTSISLCLLLAGCGGSPSSVAEAFARAMAHDDTRTALAYATGNIKTMLALSVVAGGGGKGDGGQDISVKARTCEKDGERATVKLELFNKGRSTGYRTLVLRRTKNG